MGSWRARRSTQAPWRSTTATEPHERTAAWASAPERKAANATACSVRCSGIATGAYAMWRARLSSPYGGVQSSCTMEAPARTPCDACSTTPRRPIDALTAPAGGCTRSARPAAAAAASAAAPPSAAAAAASDCCAISFFSTRLKWFAPGSST